VSDKKKRPSKKFVRSIIVFIIISAVVQLAALAFMTPQGLGAIYPYVLHMRSEEINTGDAGIGEYFSLHSEIEDAGLVILSVDTDVKDSYILAADYLRFLVKFINVSNVALYIQQMRVKSISDAAVAGDYVSFDKACDSQRELKVLCDQIYSFASSVYTMNSRLSPDKKIGMVGIKGHSKLNDIKSSLTADLYIIPGGSTGDHLEVLDAKTNEEYAALFRKHEEKLKEVLGNKFDYHNERCAFVEENAIEENFALRNLARYAPAGEKTVFAVLPEELLGNNSVFVKKAEEIYGKVVVCNTVYYDCVTLDDDKAEASRNDGDYPGFFDGIRIAEAKKLEGFRRYYKKIVNSFSSDELDGRMDLIGDTGEKTFFIISGSGPVTYNEDLSEETGTVGTVNVAPG